MRLMPNWPSAEIMWRDDNEGSGWAETYPSCEKEGREGTIEFIVSCFHQKTDPSVYSQWKGGETRVCCTLVNDEGC